MEPVLALPELDEDGRDDHGALRKSIFTEAEADEHEEEDKHKEEEEEEDVVKEEAEVDSDSDAETEDSEATQTDSSSAGSFLDELVTETKGASSKRAERAQAMHLRYGIALTGLGLLWGWWWHKQKPDDE